VDWNIVLPPIVILSLYVLREESVKPLWRMKLDSYSSSTNIIYI
jgi:hypothetical protein